jgi:hypothetical protein
MTHNDSPQSVGILWMSDQLVAETSDTQHSQKTDIHVPGGIRVHNLSRREAARPLGPANLPNVLSIYLGG